MEFEQYKNEFAQQASLSGYTEQNILKCLKYAELLFQNNVPVIYNTANLSALVGYHQRYLKRAITYTPYYYRNFQILKKNGKHRNISEPLPSLKEIQNWILKEILYNVKISAFAKAYKPNISLMENLKFHKNQSKVMTLDIKDFFSSIKLQEVEKIFYDLGYSRLVSNLLAKLCCLQDSLPQGAPTSPCLSNIFFFSADELISKYCIKNKIRYTRYADDLTFSGNFDEKKLAEFVIDIITNLNLEINVKKSKVMPLGTRQTVTGIVVNEKVQVDFKKRNEIRQAMHYIKKFGLENHMSFKRIAKANYLEHLIGKINFILQINPNDNEFIDYKKHLLNIKKNS